MEFHKQDTDIFIQPTYFISNMKPHIWGTHLTFMSLFPIESVNVTFQLTWLSALGMLVL